MSQGKLQDIRFNRTLVGSVFTSCIRAAFFCGRAVITGGKRGMFPLVALPRYRWKNGKKNCGNSTLHKNEISTDLCSKKGEEGE